MTRLENPCLLPASRPRFYTTKTLSGRNASEPRFLKSPHVSRQTVDQVIPEPDVQRRTVPTAVRPSRSSSAISATPESGHYELQVVGRRRARRGDLGRFD